MDDIQQTKQPTKSYQINDRYLINKNKIDGRYPAKLMDNI